MELRAKRRMDALNEAILQNKILTQRMAIYDASQLGIQLDEPEVGQLADLSDKNLDDNYVRQQFEKNVFRLFRNNTISAQDFIGLVSEDDYARFNTIFPQMLFNLGDQLNVDARSAYNMARTLMTKKVPKEKSDEQQPLPSATKAAQKASEAPEAVFIDEYYNEMVQCLLPGCSKSVPYRNLYSTREQHQTTKRHKKALQQYQNGTAATFSYSPQSKGRKLF